MYVYIYWWGHMRYSTQSEDNLWELTLFPPCEWVSETELQWSGLVASAFA